MKIINYSTTHIPYFLIIARSHYAHSPWSTLEAVVGKKKHDIERRYTAEWIIEIRCVYHNLVILLLFFAVLDIDRIARIVVRDTAYEMRFGRIKGRTRL